ncbi:hypothetical protein NKH18_01470 [Streptomyces sp. M10(2022)]
MLIESTDDSFRKAVAVDWQSEARVLYAKRMREAKDLTDALSDGFRKAGKALSTYAEAVTTAKNHYASGKTAEGTSPRLCPGGDRCHTNRAGSGASEAMGGPAGYHGVLDWFAEVAVDIDAIREEAERYYNQTRDHYGDARRVESQARETCTADLNSARRSIPTFNGPIKDPGSSLKAWGRCGLRPGKRQTTPTPSCRARARRSTQYPARATPW